MEKQALEINRKVYEHLTAWHNNAQRRPLLLRGARLVGKSHSVRTWAKNSGLELIEINFEEQPRFKELFEKNLDPIRILDELSVLLNRSMRLKNCLLFFDEIQSAPKALTALRYFYEKLPETLVVAAGSLLEFVIQEQGFPVGRVESLYLFPLSFFEFIEALGQKKLIEFLDSYSIDSGKQIPTLIHEELLKLLQLYYRIGGMPKVIASYLETKDYSTVSREQNIILSGYRDDFEKYASRAEWATLNTVFRKIPDLVSKTRVKFNSVDLSLNSLQVRRAIELLEHALVITRVYPSHTNKLPLEASAQEKFFKLVFLDIGLLHLMLGFDWNSLEENFDLTDICNGKFAEQFVAQELIATRSEHSRYRPHYWDRPKTGSSAEVDFVIEHKGHPAPLEVKSGTRGRLRSLDQYIKEFKPKKAFVSSQRNRESMSDIELVPLYLVSKL